MSQRGAAAGWDVFLAYPSGDRARAEVLRTALQDVGLRVCFDQDVLQPGDDWHALLPGHLRRSTVVVALISHRFDAAHYARTELVTAIDLVRREGRRVCPVLLEPDVELPYGTQQLQTLDFFDDAQAAEVARRIAGVVERPDPSQIATRKIFCDRVPVPPRHFAGREELLAQLQEAAGTGMASVVTQTIQGLGGVGKTSLAAALVEATSPTLDIVWWVRAEHPAVLVADLAELGTELGLAGDEIAGTATQAVRWLQTTTDRSWLLVFDNAPDEDAVYPWLPQRGTGTVVVTSRQRNFDRVGKVIEVETFPPDVAARFLRARVEAANPAAAQAPVDAVVERLQGLPLALEQAAAWVTRMPNRRFDDFARRLDAAGDPFPARTGPLGYEGTATTTWRVSIDAATAEAPLAERLMAALVWFAPEELPCQWLRDRAADPYLAGVGDGDATEDDVDRALEALHGYSLVRIDSADNLTIHRVVQRVTRETAPPEAAGFAVRLLHARRPVDSGDHVHWPMMRTFVPHGLAMLSLPAPVTTAHAEDICWILQAIIKFQRDGVAVRDAIATAEALATFATDHLGPDHDITVGTQVELARVWNTADDPSRAIPLLEAALAHLEPLRGTADGWVMGIRVDLGDALKNVGNHARACQVLEAVLADQERTFGDDHHNTLRTRSATAAALHAAGQLERALALSEAVMEATERIEGPSHVNTLIQRHNLGILYVDVGDAERGMAMLESTLADEMRVLGDNHPGTLLSRITIAERYLKLGEHFRAVELFRAALDDCERALGPDHPHTIKSQLGLVMVYLASGQFRHALPHAMSALARRERLLGKEHPATKEVQRLLKKIRIEMARHKR